MSTAFSLPDLDALDHAALKEMIMAQQDICKRMVRTVAGVSTV